MGSARATCTLLLHAHNTEALLDLHSRPSPSRPKQKKERRSPAEEGASDSSQKRARAAGSEAPPVNPILAAGPGYFVTADPLVAAAAHILAAHWANAMRGDGQRTPFERCVRGSVMCPRLHHAHTLSHTHTLTREHPLSYTLIHTQ